MSADHILAIKRPVRKVIAYVEWLRHRRDYPQNVLFIAGLPKSGSTWLHNMFISIPGFYGFQPDHITWTDHNLRPDTFRAYDHLLAVVKLHTYWSPANADILRREGLRYLVIYRDIRDAAVSWYYYVTNVHKNHYLRETIAPLSFDEGIHYYIDHFLASEVRWISDWRVQRDPNMSMELTYEKLRADTMTVFGEAARFMCGDLPDQVIERAVTINSFERTSGRQPGQEDPTSFVRKGISGDWRNKFTDEHKARFKDIAGDMLIETGYEQDFNW